MALHPNVILAPQTVTVEIGLEPVHNMLNSLSLLTFYEYNYGIDDWIIRTAKSLPDDVMYRQELVFGGLGGLAGVLTQTESPSIEALLNWLEQVDPYELRNQAIDDGLEGLADLFAEAHSDERVPTRDEVLADANLYLNLFDTVSALQKVEKFLSHELLREGHALLTDPPAMKALVLSHLKMMALEVFAPEWQRVLPMLDESVEAFRRLDYSHMTAIEAIRTVTGRDVRGILDDELSNTEHLIFAPSAHNGPYLSNFQQGKTMRLLFRARVPEGVKPRSPEITRSELLVRVSALADDTRLRMLELLTQHEEMCAQDIIEALDISQSAASRHLRQLSATGYLTERRFEGNKCYRLNPERIETILNALTAFLLRR